jgi:hypothetical protein
VIPVAASLAINAGPTFGGSAFGVVRGTGGRAKSTPKTSNGHMIIFFFFFRIFALERV